MCRVYGDEPMFVVTIRVWNALSDSLGTVSASVTCRVQTGRHVDWRDAARASRRPMGMIIAHRTMAS